MFIHSTLVYPKDELIYLDIKYFTYFNVRQYHIYRTKPTTYSICSYSFFIRNFDIRTNYARSLSFDKQGLTAIEFFKISYETVINNSIFIRKAKKNPINSITSLIVSNCSYSDRWIRRAFGKNKITSRKMLTRDNMTIIEQF